MGDENGSSTKPQHDPDPTMSFCTFLILFVITATLPTLFLLGFSGMGYGLEFTSSSYNHHDEAYEVLVGMGALALFLYLFDVQVWPLVLQAISYFVLFCCFSVALTLLVTDTPYGPLCVLSVAVPLLLIFFKKLCYKSVPGHVYASWIHIVLVLIGIILLGLFFYWASLGDNMWDPPTRAEYSDRASCPIDYEGLEECKDDSTPEDVPCFWMSANKEHTIDFKNNVKNGHELCTVHCLDVYENCEEAFIIWVNPFLAGMSLLVMGFLARYLKPNDPHAHTGVSAVVKFSAVFLFVFWITASMLGAGDGLSSSLIAYAISMIIGAGILISAVFWGIASNNTKEEQQEEDTEEGGALVKTDEVPKTENAYEGYIDIVKGLCVLAFSPLVIPYFILSMINQIIRRTITCCCSCIALSEDEKNHRGCVTYRVKHQIQDWKHWDHSKILVIAVYWGIGYVFLNVLASKFTTVFLSWLIDATDEMAIYKVTGIVFAVGMFLFMLPPIPGLPIYLTAGIVLVSVGKNVFGLWWSIGYACAISLALKLVACAVQQKIIGGMLGKYVGVRQAVSINSEGCRAMRVMLSDRGMTSRKVAVLVGGPDWPVSVLCGILGLDLFPVLIGTLPVVVLIAPTVLCGSFAFMGSIETEDGLAVYPWADTMGAVMSAICAGTMFFFTLSAAGAVKDTLTNSKDDIDAIPIDDEVAKADAIAKKSLDAYRRAVVWANVPGCIKLALVISVLTMMGCTYLLVLFNDKCFKEYDLMYTIEQHLGGNWTNIVLPLGRVALLLFGISYVLLLIFEWWAKAQAKAAMELEKEEEGKPLTDTPVPTYA